MPQILEDKLMEDLEPVVKGLGYDIVELRAKPVKKAFHVVMAVYRPSGVGLDDCAAIHRTVLPRIEMQIDSRDVHLEISSPGISRTLKSDREFSIFIGRGVRVLPADSEEWVAGTIGDTTEEGIVIQTKTDPQFLPYGKIRKAKLDHTQEDG
jgi:ribosome maturation factor RimP